MSNHIPHPTSRVESWSRPGPAATGHRREWRATSWLALTLVTAGCGATYREVRPSAAVEAAAGNLRVDVQRVFLTDETIENGVADGAALVVELTVTNAGPAPYTLKPTTLWCLMQIDARKPDETRLLPPSVNGDGPFPGSPPEGSDLTQIDVAPGQRRSFWVLFRGYRFAGSEIPRRITLSLPDAEGRALELVLADPARGDLRWEVPPTRGAWYLGVQTGSLYGGYTQTNSISSRVSHLASAGRFLWDAGLVSTVLVQVQGALRSASSSFMGIGLDAHLTLPLYAWGDPLQPIRLGPYLGGQIRNPGRHPADAPGDERAAAADLRRRRAGGGPRARRRGVAERSHAVPPVGGREQPAAPVAGQGGLHPQLDRPRNGRWLRDQRPPDLVTRRRDPFRVCFALYLPEAFSRWPPKP